MKTQKIQIAHNLPYKSKMVKDITIPRIFFHKEYTKIDFAFNPNKAVFLNMTNKKVNINPNIYIQTVSKKYRVLSGQIFEKPFFKQEADYKYFSLLFEPIDEDIERFKIVDDFNDKQLLNFSFSEISLV